MAQINKPSEYFNTVTYTGNETDDHAITGVGFQPDWLWIKNRDSVKSHLLVDVVRGTTKYLFSDLTNAEGTYTTIVKSFDTDGFTLGTNNNSNENNSNIVAWNWLAGGTASSNTDGSITSQVSASTTSGFSIVSYTGTGSNATVGHGLGVAPAVVLVKDRTTGGYDWFMYHHKNTSEPATDYLRLNLTSATTDNVVVWNDTAPTSSVFSIGTSVGVNANTDEYIAYCFAEKKGFSKAFSYTGNGNADGSFVFCGFRPAFVMIKRSSSTENWWIHDNKRKEYNPRGTPLKANGSDAEISSVNESSYAIDFLSNGFKARTSEGSVNSSGATYVGIAFAANPLVGTNNIPSCAV